MAKLLAKPLPLETLIGRLADANLENAFGRLVEAGTLYVLHPQSDRAEFKLLSRCVKHHTLSFWMLPHGSLSDAGHVTQHPERLQTDWALQRLAFGPCLFVEGKLLQRALEPLRHTPHWRAPALLHALVLQLNQLAPGAWVEAPPQPIYACTQALEDSYTGQAFPFTETQAPDWYRNLLGNASRQLDAHGELMPDTPKTEAHADAKVPRLSILIPFKDAPQLLEACINAILAQAENAPPFEVIGINNQSESPETARLMARLTQRDERIRFVEYPHDFNYAAMMNLGARAAKGEVLLQLNNDVELHGENALARLYAWAMAPETGAVGARLHYPDGSLQHLGLHMGLSGHVGHLFRGRETASLPLGWQGCTRRVTAVTGALLAIRKSVYEAVGGMDETHFPIGFNDVDLCLQLAEAGYENRVLWAVHATHHESVTRRRTHNPLRHIQERRERQYFYYKYKQTLKRFDETLSRGFDLRDDAGLPAASLWKNAISRRVFKTRLPFTQKRLSLFLQSNNRYILSVEDPAELPTPPTENTENAETPPVEDTPRV